MRELLGWELRWGLVVPLSVSFPGPCDYYVRRSKSTRRPTYPGLISCSGQALVDNRSDFPSSTDFLFS